MINTFILIFGLISVIVVILFCLKFRSQNNKYLKKIDTLKSEIIKNKKRNQLIKIKSYHVFFKTVRHIFTHFKPETISVYLYDKKPELNTTIMNFLYQIKSDGGDGTIIFTGKYNNIPITNIYAVTNIYYKNNILSITNIDEISQYDKGLYMNLIKNEIKRLYLVNIYKKNRKKPIGFFALTYKDKILMNSEKETLIEETNKISIPLTQILS